MCGGSRGRRRGRDPADDPVDMKSSPGGPGWTSLSSDETSGDRDGFSNFDNQQ